MSIRLGADRLRVWRTMHWSACVIHAEPIVYRTTDAITVFNLDKLVQHYSRRRDRLISFYR